MNWKELYNKLSFINLMLVLMVGLYFNLFMKPLFTLSFLIGAVISLLNFYIMQKGIQAMFSKDGLFMGNKGAFISKFYFRLAIIGIIIYILLGKNVDPIGLILGLSTVTAGIVIIGVYYGIKFYRENKRSN